MPKKLTKEEFIEKAKSIHGEKYDYSEVNYLNSHTNVKLKCNRCGNFFFVKPNNHLSQKAGCVKCNQKEAHDKAKCTLENFMKKYKIIQKNNDLEFIDLKNEYVDGLLSKLTMKCRNCETIFIRRAINLLKHQTCPCCVKKIKSKKLSSSNEEFIEKAKKVHSDKFDYSEINYCGSRNKLKIKCNTCNNIFFQTPSNHLSGKGCPHCKMSKGEKLVEKILMEENIVFKKQFKFVECKNKRSLLFDFYLPENNICIEFQGQQHYEKFRFEKDDKCLKNRQKLDQIKRNYCENNNITLIEIRYDENIKEKLLMAIQK